MSVLIGLFHRIKKGVKSVSPPPAGDALLLETGDYVLLETGDKILLE